MTTTASPRRPRKDAAANRSLILSAAAGLLRSNPSVSLAEVADAAGLTRRAVYGHFPDRDALVQEVVRHGAERFDALVATPLPEAPLDALAHLTLMLWNEAAPVSLGAAVALSDAFVGTTAKGLVNVRRSLREIVARGQEDGSIRTDLAGDLVARMIEEAARASIARLDPAAPDSAEIASLAVLAAAGLGWREAREVLSRGGGSA